MRKSFALGLPASVVVVGILGCSAGAGGVDDDVEGSSGGSDGAGASTQTGFGQGGSAGTAGGCTAPNCIGGAQQGNCDTGLAIDSADPMDGARALGICKVAEPGTWGVIEAAWVRSDGQPLVGGDGGLFGDGTDLPSGKGILDRFGNSIQPREGAKLLAISSGAARNPGEPSYYSPGGDWKDSQPHGSPPGYPKESPSCPGVTTGQPYDSAGLRVRLLVPADAKSISFNLNFYTYEFPYYICSQYNDFFVAMMDPKVPELEDGNISFDAQGNTLSVNAGFLQVCYPQVAGGKNFDCPLGPGELAGTGFDEQANGSAATSWLETKAPVVPGSEITLHFAVWDSGDGVLDSTTLLDNFRFEVDETSTGTTPVPQ
jgi:hypothetical protein